MRASAQQFGSSINIKARNMKLRSPIATASFDEKREAASAGEDREGERESRDAWFYEQRAYPLKASPAGACAKALKDSAIVIHPQYNGTSNTCRTRLGRYCDDGGCQNRQHVQIQIK